MKLIHLTLSGLLLILLTITQQTFGQNKTSSWTEDFSNEALLKKNWSKYDRTVKGTSDRYWQIENGIIRGLAYQKIHPVGIMRDVSGKNIRLTCRVKLGKGAGIYIGFNGMNNGADRVRPDQKHINFRRDDNHIFASQKISFYDEHYIHLSAEELKDKKNKTCQGNLVTQKLTFSTDVWYDIKIEKKGNDMTIWLNEKKDKTHTMQSGNEPKKNINLSEGNESRDTNHKIVSAWFDDMKFETID